jgi:hypothetical protein
MNFEAWFQSRYGYPPEDRPVSAALCRAGWDAAKADSEASLVKDNPQLRISPWDEREKDEVNK